MSSNETHAMEASADTVSRECLACEGDGYEVSDEGTYEPDVHIYPCPVCDGSGIEPPAAVKIEAQAAIEKNEATMRTDFARVKQLRAESRTSGWHWSEECAERADHIEAAWRASDHAEDWDYLDRAHLEWREFPDTMGSLFQHMHKARSDTGVCPVTEMQWRSQEQARDLTGHGRQWEQPQDRSRELAGHVDDWSVTATEHPDDSGQERLKLLPERFVNAFSWSAHSREGGYGR